jgi:maleate isomerase
MTDDLAAPAVRARIGLIIPSSNRLTEPQMRQYAPVGVEAHVTRLRMTGASHVPLPELMPRIVEATAALDDARCDVSVFHCTASSMEAGLAGERLVLEAMRGATQRPVATTASAALAAFEALDVRRIALVSPYARATQEHELAFLAEAGLEVVGERALELDGSDAYIEVPPGRWLDIGEQAMRDAPTAQALFLSCTNIHSLPVVSALESRFGRLVVTSNQAVLWYALRRCGLSERLVGLGQLFRLDLGGTSTRVGAATAPVGPRPAR